MQKIKNLCLFDNVLALSPLPPCLLRSQACTHLDPVAYIRCWAEIVMLKHLETLFKNSQLATELKRMHEYEH